MQAALAPAEDKSAVKRSGALLAALAAFVVVAPAHALGPRNPLGVTIVRFAPGTSPAQMREAVAKAGGVVTSDLSAIGALAVAPRAADFTSRIRATGRVTTAFGDAFVRDSAGPDLARDRFGPGPGAGPALGAIGFPDPWHDATSFWGESNPEGILQWEDNRMNVPAAWATTRGDRTVRVAVLDSGVDGSHRELRSNFDRAGSKNLIPCLELVQVLGLEGIVRGGLRDCANADTEGHGTWVASRIAAAANGFASNGVAPNVQIVGYKVLAAGFGGLTSWILAGMLEACSARVDLVNMSLGGFLDPNDPVDAQDYLLFVDAVDYCRSKGATVFSSPGNEHVRLDRVDATIGGRSLRGVGLVSGGHEGFATVPPGSESLADWDYRGALEFPGGVPGVVLVSATANAVGAAPTTVPLRWRDHVGARDQLAYYSSYGSRIDLAAPGGARKFNIPRYDGGPGDILYGGWGSLGALVATGDLCTDPTISSPSSFACFSEAGAAFGWLQGTSMAVPNAVGVAALTISAHPRLRRRPEALVARLQATARRDLTNYMGPNDPSNFAPSLAGAPCGTGFCHVDQTRAIRFADAYGAGLVNAAGATAR